MEALRAERTVLQKWSQMVSIAPWWPAAEQFINLTSPTQSASSIFIYSLQSKQTEEMLY